MNLYISILESAYLIYMFLFFQTTLDFGIGPTPNGYWFEHLIGNKKGLRICPFGRVAIFFFIGILIGRHFFNIPYFNYILLFTFLLSLVNTNATVYLLPVFIIELIL